MNQTNGRYKTKWVNAGFDRATHTHISMVDAAELQKRLINKVQVFCDEIERYAYCKPQEMTNALFKIQTLVRVLNIVLQGEMKDAENVKAMMNELHRVIYEN